MIKKDNLDNKLCKQKINEFETALTKSLINLGDSIGDTFKTRIIDRDNQDFNENYELESEACSEKVEEYRLCWYPFKKELCGCTIIVREKYQGKGIGTSLINTTEEIAYKLGVKKVIMSSILHENYWDNRKDYAVEGTDAVKMLG